MQLGAGLDVQLCPPFKHIAQHKAEVQGLLSLSGKTDQAEAEAVPEGVKLPEELKWREDRLAAMATPIEVMAHRLKTKEVRKRYALCKQIVEPEFGIIKFVMRFRQFSLRGVAKVRGGGASLPSLEFEA